MISILIINPYSEYPEHGARDQPHIRKDLSGAPLNSGHVKKL